jgi:hypothetical protein
MRRDERRRRLYFVSAERLAAALKARGVAPIVIDEALTESGDSTGEPGALTLSVQVTRPSPLPKEEACRRLQAQFRLEMSSAIARDRELRLARVF